MPWLSALCQRCNAPITYQMRGGLPVALDGEGTPHPPSCPVPVPWGEARAVEVPQLVRVVTRGFVIGIDLETTGIPGRTERPEIIELAAALLRMEDGEIVDQFQILVKPVGPLLAQDVHHITDEMVANAPQLRDAIHQFNGWRAAAQAQHQPESPIPLVSHNAAFELSFLDPCEVGGPWICSLQLSQSLTQTRTVRGFHALSSIVDRMGLSYDGPAHRALWDARICAQVYWMMVYGGQLWDDLVRVVGTDLGHLRGDLASRAPVTAALLLEVEQTLMRRLRRFQDRPRVMPPPPTSPFVVPWSPPEEVEPDYPWAVYDPAVFRPLPRLLEVIARVYRAERLGLSLDGLAQVRSRPRFDDERAPTVLELTSEGDEEDLPTREAPHRPEYGTAPRPSLPREEVPEVPTPNRRAPHQPNLASRPIPSTRPSPEPPSPTERRAQNERPDFSRPPTQTSPHTGASRADLEPSRPAPVRPRYGSGS